MAVKQGSGSYLLPAITTLYLPPHGLLSVSRNRSSTSTNEHQQIGKNMNSNIHPRAVHYMDQATATIAALTDEERIETLVSLIIGLNKATNRMDITQMSQDNGIQHVLITSEVAMLGIIVKQVFGLDEDQRFSTHDSVMEFMRNMISRG